MDDWVVMAITRWRLRRAIKAVNEVMATLRVVKHRDKTFIGRIARGFDFLGYWFSDRSLSVAAKTVGRMVEKVGRLYEQGADDFRIDLYLLRWARWVRSGLGIWGGGLKGLEGKLEVERSGLETVRGARTLPGSLSALYVQIQSH